MSFKKLVAATVLLSVTSLCSAQDLSFNNWKPSLYLPRPINSPLDGDFIGRYDSTVYFSGYVDTPNSTVAVFAQTYSGTWAVVAVTKSSNNKSRLGGYKWSVSDSIPLKCWDVLNWSNYGFSASADIKVINYPHLYGPEVKLGEVTVYSFSRSP